MELSGSRHKNPRKKRAESLIRRGWHKACNRALLTTMDTQAISPAPTPKKAQKPAPKKTTELGHHTIVIIGGGTAGLTVAARLHRAGQTDIAIIEPSEKHYYQPLWTLVGGGIVSAEETERPEESLIPSDCRWIKDYAEEIDPEAKKVRVRGGGEVGYDYLVVAPGIQLDWDKIPGMRQALESDCVSSNYDFRLAPKTARLIENFRGGTALFMQPAGPFKCGGAPQKIMYLAADYFRRTGKADRSRVVFASPLAAIFGVAEFRAVLEKVVERYGIDTRFQHTMVEIRPDQREAVFDAVAGEGKIERRVIQYDMMHVVPPQSAPDFIKKSPIASPEGWAAADKYTLQHPVYPNVFALGDASSLPAARTGAAIRKQAPVLVENLIAVMNGKEPAAKYNGYSSCPLVLSYETLLLAEFDYDSKPAPSIPLINTIKERHDMYLLKRYGLPWLYWNLMLKGLA